MQKLDRLTVLWDDNGISIDGKVDARRRDRPDGALRRGGLVDARLRRPRPRGHRPRADRGGGEPPARASSPARPISASARRPSRTPRPRTARRSAPRRSRRCARSTAGSTRRSSCPTTSATPGRATGARGARRAARLGGAARQAAARQARRVRAGDRRRRRRRKLVAALTAYRKAQSAAAPKVATRKASEMALEVVNAVMPETLGGSADLTGSNNTLTKGLGVFDAGQPRRALPALRHPRARHGRGDERAGAARRGRALRRHLPGLRRLRRAARSGSRA